MNNQKIYAVHSWDWDDLYSVQAVFDSLEKAHNFLTRFKTRQNLKIFELVLNPDYISDQKQDPYHIEFAGTEPKPDEISICTFIEDAEEAAAEIFSVDICASDDIEDAIFSVKIFAQTEEEAVYRAIQIRNDGIARGEWHNEHEKILAVIAETNNR